MTVKVNRSAIGVARALTAGTTVKTEAKGKRGKKPAAAAGGGGLLNNPFGGFDDIAFDPKVGFGDDDDNDAFDLKNFDIGLEGDFLPSPGVGVSGGGATVDVSSSGASKTKQPPAKKKRTKDLNRDLGNASLDVEGVAVAARAGAGTTGGVDADFARQPAGVGGRGGRGGRGGGRGAAAKAKATKVAVKVSKDALSPTARKAAAAARKKTTAAAAKREREKAGVGVPRGGRGAGPSPGPGGADFDAVFFGTTKDEADGAFGDAAATMPDGDLDRLFDPEGGTGGMSGDDPLLEGIFGV